MHDQKYSLKITFVSGTFGQIPELLVNLLLVLFVNRRTRNTGAELPVELGTRPGPVTKIRYRWVCETPVDLLLNLGTLSKVTIYIYPAEPMVCMHGF